MNSVYEMAKMYFPKYWGVKRIEALYELGKLSQEEYDKLIGGKE